MKKILPLLLTMLIPSLSHADGTEVSLFSGYRSGGDMENADTGTKASFDEASSYGIIIAKDYGPEHVMEFLYSHQTTDLRSGGQKLMNLDIEYFQVGGSQIWADKKIDKFFGGTLGAIHLSPNGAAGTSESKFAMSFGGGIVYKFTENIGLRLEVRGYFSSIGNSEAFCAGNNCIVVGSGFMRQFDVNAGLRFRF